jgi:hypothetical protein
MGKLENKSSKWGFLPWLLIVVGIGIAAWIVTPHFIVISKFFPQPMSKQNACVNNLRQIDGAKNEWVLENGKTNGAVCTENDIKNFIKLDVNGNLPKCPQGGIYTIGKVGEPPTCSLGTNVIPAHVLP